MCEFNNNKTPVCISVTHKSCSRHSPISMCNVTSPGLSFPYPKNFFKSFFILKFYPCKCCSPEGKSFSYREVLQLCSSCGGRFSPDANVPAQFRQGEVSQRKCYSSSQRGILAVQSQGLLQSYIVQKIKTSYKRFVGGRGTSQARSSSELDQKAGYILYFCGKLRTGGIVSGPQA